MKRSDVMSTFKKIRKYKEVKLHRDWQYQKAIQGVIDGDLPPEYSAKRWQKKKALEHK